MDDAATRFRALSLPANYPSFAFVHGFLCSVTTTPSLIVPAEWSESLHDGIHFNSRAQLDSLFDVLVPLTNSLLTEIHTGQLHIPPCIAQSDMSLDSWDQFVDWSRGFSVAHQEFHHLWDFVLSELEEKAEHTRALGDELWEQLNLNWFGLGLSLIHI